MKRIMLQQYFKHTALLLLMLRQGVMAQSCACNPTVFTFTFDFSGTWYVGRLSDLQRRFAGMIMIGMPIFICLNIAVSFLLCTYTVKRVLCRSDRIKV